MNAIIVSTLLGVIMMFCSWGIKSQKTQHTIALVGLFVLIISNLAQLNGWFVIDFDTKGMLAFTRFGLFVNTLFFVITFIYIWLNGEEIAKFDNQAADFYALFFFILCGASILTSFDNLLMLFIGIEILSIPLYILTGADKKNLFSNEAALKYFLMGSFSTGILLLGITFIYGATGSFHLVEPILRPSDGLPKEQMILSAGLLLVFAAMNFKVSAAPFHFWTPDVYDGAPTVFTSFMATIVKAAGFIAFITIFNSQSKALGYTWELVLSFVIVSTLLVGNIVAVFQRSVKRMLAYSSIAQAGFMLFALYGKSIFATEGIVLYATVYSLATIGVFGVLIKMKENSFEAFNGLAKANPLLAFVTTIFLFSLAGIPLTGGFFAKYYMLNALYAAGAGLWLIIIAILFAAVSVFYYFKLVQAMYFASGEPTMHEVPKKYTYALLLIAILLLILGVFPSVVFNYLYF
ncbi:MAG: NADH-quinone oxidoreductase subunit N [Chitinophagaceae bacterium]|jgi:NADH-quinone oxidoreductase subunit N|nr:NADH-quinone oxidoreductase subunit N [Chitinophagaceae bacterium]